MSIWSLTTNKAYLRTITVTNILRVFTYNTAAKINRHRYGTKITSLLTYAADNPAVCSAGIWQCLYKKCCTPWSKCDSTSAVTIETAEPAYWVISNAAYLPKSSKTTCDSFRDVGTARWLVVYGRRCPISGRIALVLPRCRQRWVASLVAGVVRAQEHNTVLLCS